MTTYNERARMYRAAGRLLLPHGEEDERRTYVMPDPDEAGTGEALRALWEAYDAPGDKVTVRRDDLVRVLGLAIGYLDLTTYELGQEHCVRKLRDIWRARRAR